MAKPILGISLNASSIFSLGAHGKSRLMPKRTDTSGARQIPCQRSALALYFAQETMLFKFWARDRDGINIAVDSQADSNTAFVYSIVLADNPRPNICA
jgi:hypothetical protein